MNRRFLSSLTLALGLALILGQPLAGPVFAHPAAPHAPAAAGIGKTGSLEMTLTLHLHSYFSVGSGLTFVAADAQGNFYVSSDSLDQVRMYDANSSYLRSFGSGAFDSNNGDFEYALGIAVSGNNVFIADSGNHRIQVFNKSTGSWISEFGDANLLNPAGLAIGSNGTLYVTDQSANAIAEFSTGGTFLGSFGGAGSGNGQFNDLVGIAASPFGTLYVADSDNKRVQAFDLAGHYVTQWGAASFQKPAGIAVDRAGMVYVTDYLAQIVYKFDAGGSLVGSYSAPASGTQYVPGTLNLPDGVAVSNVPNTPITVYVANRGNSEVLRFDQVTNPQTHSYQAQWGSFGSGTGQFSDPQDSVVDAVGNVYVADYNNDRVEKFDQFGNFLLAFGGSGSGNGQFSGPTWLAASPDGSTIYVADNGNSRVEEFNPSGGYLGQFGAAGSGDGQFNGPKGIATDGLSVFVADSGNNRIEVFDAADGSYVYQFGDPGSGPTQFLAPRGIAVDINRQELFIADYGNNRVQLYGTDGTFFASLPSANGLAFSGPSKVATDQRGDVYVSDVNNNRVVEFDVNLTHTTSFGGSGSGNGQFSFPVGVAVSPTSGQIYVVDEGHNRIQRFGSPWPKDDTIGVYRPSTKTFYLRNENLTGPADLTVYMPYAQAGDLPIVGDWNGDGVDTVGLYRPSKSRFLLQDSNTQESAPDYVFTLGIPGDTPIAGDWNGQGSDGAGIFRPSNGILYLKNQLSTGIADYQLVLGVPGDVGIAGDWNGDGQDSPGVYRPSTQRFYVTNKVTGGIVTSDHSAVLGISGDAPFTGDWIGQGFSGIGVFRPSNGVTYEKNIISTGPADNNFVYGIAGDIPVAGQWVAPQVPFSAPPHTSLGTRGGATAAPASGSHTPTPAQPTPGGRAPALPARRTARAR